MFHVYAKDADEVMAQMALATSKDPHPTPLQLASAPQVHCMPMQHGLDPELYPRQDAALCQGQ